MRVSKEQLVEHLQTLTNWVDVNFKEGDKAQIQHLYHLLTNMVDDFDCDFEGSFGKEGYWVNIFGMEE